MSSAETNDKKKIVVLISGSGTNLQALIDASQKEGSVLNKQASIVSVISNRTKAFGLERASKAGIPTKVLTLAAAKKEGKTREQFDQELVQIISDYKPDLVVLAGFMHILSADFLDRLNKPIINLHPALPGEFDGAHAIDRAFEAFKEGKTTHTGVMVHWVTKVVDGGKPIITRKIDIEANETLESLETKIHTIEHKIIVEATELVITGKETPPASM